MHQCPREIEGNNRLRAGTAARYIRIFVGEGQRGRADCRLAEPAPAMTIDDDYNARNSPLAI